MRYLAALVLLFPFFVSADLVIDSVSVNNGVATVVGTISENDHWWRTEVSGTCYSTGHQQGNGQHTVVFPLNLPPGQYTKDFTLWENNVPGCVSGKQSLNTISVDFEVLAPIDPPAATIQSISTPAGGQQPWCSSPTAPGYNITYKDGGCNGPTLENLYIDLIFKLKEYVSFIRSNLVAD